MIKKEWFMEQKNCLVCGSFFSYKRKTMKYCSNACKCKAFQNRKNPSNIFWLYKKAQTLITNKKNLEKLDSFYYIAIKRKVK
jgi:hypothetical protein